MSVPRRCSTCSTAHSIRRRDGEPGCAVCDLLERAETRDAAARALHDLLIATYDLRSRGRDDEQHVTATSGALELAIDALENEARNLRHVARCVARTLEPHRTRRRARA